MKRLLTYLGLLATLLAMPYYAKADTWAYYLYGEINADDNGNWNAGNAKTDTYKFGDTSNSSDNITWTKTFTGAQLDRNGNGEALFKILLDKDGTNTNLGPNGSNDKKLEVNGSAETLYKDAGKAYKVTGIEPDAEYVIKYVSSSREGGTISIIGPATKNENLKLKGWFDWGDGRTCSSFSEDGIYTWEFDKSEFPSDTKKEFKLCEDLEGDKNDKWYSNGLEITEDWSSEFSDNGDNMWMSYSDPNNDIIKISVQAMKSNGKWKMRIVKTYEPHDYYWVSPQITNNQMWPAFKMVASRNRYWSGTEVIGDGLISAKYYTFTIKNDDLVTWNSKSEIDENTPIQWYILRDDGKVVYRPKTDLVVDYKPNKNVAYDDKHPISGKLDDDYVSYINFWNGSTYDGADAYMTTDVTNRKGSWAFNKKSAKAHTFNLNAEKGHVLYNYTKNGASDANGYKLAGNWSAGRKVSIDISKAIDMTPYYYYDNGKESKTSVAGSDSIVYKVTVNRPAEGWGGLYLDVLPASNADWDHAIRPLITLGNNLDGRALHGAMTTASSNQSLNPEASSDYTSYTFSFNATTMTYRLEFHTSLYLVGPGVSATKGTGSWDLSKVKSTKPSEAFDPRIRLKPTQEKDHYRNHVYFTNGGQFRFIKNTDESTNPNYAYTWYENDKKPLWNTATKDADYYPDSETQFRNNMVYVNGTGTAPTEGDQSMTFDLPSGWYYVNFYPNAATPYYTIEHSMELRDFNEVYYRSAAVPAGEVRKVEGRNDYNFLRVWSDHIAWNKPDNIDVFVVSEFKHDAEKHKTTATLTKLNIDYIPAKTGVILGCKLSKDNLTSGLVYNDAATLAYNNGQNVNYYNTLTAELTPYSAPSTYYDGASKLKPLYSAESLKRFSDETGIGTGDGYANYLFGFYRRNKYQKNYTGDSNYFDMGFWLTTGEGKTYANSAFLHLTKEEAEDLGVGTDYNMSSFSAPAFMLLFDESDDNVITGISDITTAKGNSVAPQGWYTLQGVRTAKPTQRGIYIYNGKKVIVND